MHKPEISENCVPLFTRESFFRQGESVYIHSSDEFREYIGIPHKHEFIEITYIVSGCATHIVDGKSYSVQKGDLSVINSREAHCFIANSSCGEKFETYDLMFTTDFLSNEILSGEDFSTLSRSFLFYSLFPDENGYIRRLNLIKDCGFEFESIFAKIYDEYKRHDIGCINLIRVYTAELIIKLFRKINASYQSRLSQSQKEVVRSVVSYIKANYNISIKMEDISSKLFFNKDYITKLFKREFGMPVSDFIREIRINEACRLLLTTNKIISDIALSCGYNDMKTFYAAFRKTKGMTPNKYRESARNQKKQP